MRLSPDDKLSSLRELLGVSIFEVWQMSPLLVKLGRGRGQEGVSINLSLVTTDYPDNNIKVVTS